MKELITVTLACLAIIVVTTVLSLSVINEAGRRCDTRGRHARWVYDGVGANGNVVRKCSVCGCKMAFPPNCKYPGKIYMFCPICGNRMDEKEIEEYE